MYIRYFLFALMLLSGLQCGNDSGSPSAPADVKKPEAPRVLDRRFSDGEARFCWENSEGAVRWNIYRSVGEDSVFVKIASVTTSCFTETGLRYDESYSYRIAGVARDDREGPFADVKGVPRNNLYPTSPRGLRADSRNFEALGLSPRIVFRWLPNDESDFRTYRIHLIALPDTAVVSQEIDSPDFQFENAEVGRTYLFRVSAVDKGELESSPTELTVEVLRPVILEFPVEGEVSAPAPVFRWKAIPGASYEISVSASPGGIQELWFAELEPSSAPSIRYTGPKLETGTFWWKVLARVSEEGITSVSLSRLANFTVN